jgi:delta 1-pyrroline-5-carboxylate dehydrogenase
MSLWRKRNVHHNEQKPDHLVNILTNSSIKSEQKHDILTYPLDILHDLSIKSDNLSIKSWVGLTDEEIGMAFRAVFPVGGVVFTNGATEFAKTIERKLKEKNT